jgi:cobalamin biosynthesis protein CobT
MKIEIDGDSPEAVALALLHLVAEAEGRLDDEGRIVGASRAWLLDAYVECLAAVNGARTFGRDDKEEEDDGDDEESEGDEDEGGDEEEDEKEDEEEHEEERKERADTAPRRRR